MQTRALVATWPTGCASSHGIPAIDEARALLFAGCSSARTVVLDLARDGKELGSFTLGTGATILAYSPRVGHLYVRGDPGTAIAILAVPDAGSLTLLGQLETTPKGHCMTADDRGQLWVCDWREGKILRFKDPYPP